MNKWKLGKRILILSVISSACILSLDNVLAGSDTENLNVSSSIDSSCSVSTEPLVLNSDGTINASSTSKVSVACTVYPNSGTTVKVGIGASSQVGGDTKRQVIGTAIPGNVKSYDIYKDNAGTLPWGDNDLTVHNYNAPDATFSFDTQATKELTVYGKLVSALTIADSYTDTIPVRVEY